MPLLRVESPRKPNIFRLQLDRNTADRLRRYSRFAADGTIDSIITSALNYSFDADKEFVEWEKKPENQLEPDPPKRKLRPSENGVNSTPSAATEATAKK